MSISYTASLRPTPSEAASVLQQPQAEALKVQTNGSIEAIGSDEAVLAQARGVSCRRDLQGAFLMPVRHAE